MAASALLTTALDILHVTGVARLARPLFAGSGVIFMLHHVRPAQPSRGFAPNGGLEVTPAFLNQVIELVRDKGYKCVSLDELAERISTGAHSERPFACFTLDDGYRDNLVHGLPVFRRHNCPFTIYVAPAIADGTCELWWRGLEALIAGENRLDVELAGKRYVLDCATDRQKLRAWRRLYWPLRRVDQHHQRRWISAVCAAHGIDLSAICRAEAMSWDEVRAIAREPLCTIGAHTNRHFALAQLGEDEARAEMRGSADRLELELGRRPRHFAYPYGDPLSASPRDFGLAQEAGFATAVTTRKGLIFRAHRDHLTALPRLSLSGDYQKLSYVEALLSGAPFALLNGLRRVKVA